MIDVTALKKNILDLAIQGKFTKNFQSEEDVSTIIFKIINEKGIEKSAIDEQIPFEIKSSWCWIQLGWIMEIERGGSPRPIKAFITEEENGINWIKIGDVAKDGKYIEKTKEKIKPEGEKKSRRVFPGDFLLTNSMSFGRPYISKIDGCVHDGWLILRNAEALFDIDFLYYLLSSAFVYSQFSKRASGSTVDNLNIDKVADAVVPLPPIEEQKRIVDKIEKIFTVLDNIDSLQKQYHSNTEILKSKIIDAGIQGKLTEQLSEDGTAEELYRQIVNEKDEIIKVRKGRKDKNIKEISDDVPYDIPKHWKWIRFGNVGLFKKGPFGSALTKSMFVPKGSDTIKVYEQQHAIKKNSEIGTYYITRHYFDESMSGFEVLSGDIIVSCAGTIGETYIMSDNIEQGIINQALMRITLVSGVDKRFFQYYFDANLKKNAQDESNGSAINNIPPFEVMKNWYFPLPPLAEQKRIAEKIDKIIAVCG